MPWLPHRKKNLSQNKPVNNTINIKISYLFSTVKTSIIFKIIFVTFNCLTHLVIKNFMVLVSLYTF